MVVTLRYMDLQLPMQSVSITTKVVSLNPVHCKVHSIQHYVIKLNLSVTYEDRWFSPGTPVSFTNKTDRHDIAEILLKVALSTITLTLTIVIWISKRLIFFFY